MLCTIGAVVDVCGGTVVVGSTFWPVAWNRGAGTATPAVGALVYRFRARPLGALDRCLDRLELTGLRMIARYGSLVAKAAGTQGRRCSYRAHKGRASGQTAPPSLGARLDPESNWTRIDIQAIRQILARLFAV